MRVKSRFINLRSPILFGIVILTVMFSIPLASARLADSDPLATSTATATTSTNDFITGSGTPGYIPLYLSQYTIGNSAIYQNGSKIGIGTTSPGTLLDVGNAVIKSFAPNGTNTLAFGVRSSVGNTSTWHTSASFYADRTEATTQSTVGGEGYAVSSHKTGNVNLLIGLVGIGDNVDTGNATSVRGVQGVAGNSGNGTVESAASLVAPSPFNTGNGSITSAFGLYIDDIKTGGTRYGIYQNGDDMNYFGGDIGIGRPPIERLTVSGGNIAVTTQGNGVILHATDGPNCYKITVNNAGALSSTLVGTC